MSTDAERIAILEARVEALSATIKTVLTTLVLRGTLTKPAVDAILREAESLFSEAPSQLVRESCFRVISTTRMMVSLT